MQGPLSRALWKLQVCSQPLGAGEAHHQAGVQAWHREILSLLTSASLPRPTLGSGTSHPVFLCLENKESHYSSPSTFQKQRRWSPLCMYPMSKCQMVRDEKNVHDGSISWLGIFVRTVFVEWSGSRALSPSFLPFSNCFQLRKLPYLCSQFPCRRSCNYIVLLVKRQRTS